MLRRMAACGAAAAALLALTTGCGEQDQRAGATATATTGASTSQAKAAAKRADAAQVAENELSRVPGPRARCRPAGGGWDAECHGYDPLERRRLKFGVLVTNGKLGETSGVVPVRAPLPRTNAELRVAHQRWVLRTNGTCDRKNEDRSAPRGAATSRRWSARHAPWRRSTDRVLQPIHRPAPRTDPSSTGSCGSWPVTT